MKNLNTLYDIILAIDNKQIDSIKIKWCDISLWQKLIGFIKHKIFKIEFPTKFTNKELKIFNQFK